MEKQREDYKNTLYKKTYLKNYIDKLKQAVVYQEELIQREAMLKVNRYLIIPLEMSLDNYCRVREVFDYKCDYTCDYTS
jgi:hypothetical protein